MQSTSFTLIAAMVYLVKTSPYSTLKDDSRLKGNLGLHVGKGSHT